MRRHAMWLVPVVLAFVSACAGSSPTPGTGTLTPSASTPQTSVDSTPQTSVEVDVCALVPLGDVQAHSPFTTPLVTAEIQVSPTVCLYSNWHETVVPAPDPVSITMKVESFGSHADAMTAFHNSEQDSTNLGVSPQAIAGVGDVASAFPGGDEVSVQAVLGNRTIAVKLKGQWPDVSDGQKVPAGTALVKLMIARLP